MFNKKTILEYAISGKTVLLRADYNVPLDDKNQLTSKYRLTQSLPTIQALLEKNCKIVIISHLGRPKSKEDTRFSLKPIARQLSELLNQPVLFANDCTGDAVAEATKKLKPREIILLENLRFYPEEKKNDSEFAERIATDSNADVFVQDGFGVVHRAHASTDAITKFLPAISGLLLEKEVSTITNVMKDPKRPLMAIIGGAKIADKITIIDEFIKKADIVAIGGAMANTFLLAQGIEVGDSLVDKDELDTAHDVMEMAREEAKKRKFVFYLPQDGVVATEISNKTHTRIVDWDAHVIADIESYPAKPDRSAFKVAKDEKILDIGPFSGAFIAGAMQMVETVVWNGTMGVSEVAGIGSPVGPFAHGTELVIDGLVGRFGHKPFSVLGGGDTTAYVEQRGYTDMFNHVSTGGGASLELMGGKSLPGIEALLNKQS
jgi:3-phosphoglycerate kinase